MVGIYAKGRHPEGQTDDEYCLEEISAIDSLLKTLDWWQIFRRIKLRHDRARYIYGFMAFDKQMRPTRKLKDIWDGQPRSQTNEQ